MPPPPKTNCGGSPGIFTTWLKCRCPETIAAYRFNNPREPTVWSTATQFVQFGTLPGLYLVVVMASGGWWVTSQLSPPGFLAIVAARW